MEGLTTFADPLWLDNVTLTLCDEVAVSAVVAVTDVDTVVDLVVLTAGCCCVVP